MMKRFFSDLGKQAVLPKLFVTLALAGNTEGRT